MPNCPHCNKLLDIETMQSLHTICVNQEAFTRELNKFGLEMYVERNGALKLKFQSGVIAATEKGATTGMPLDVQKELLDMLEVPKGTEILSHVQHLMGELVSYRNQIKPNPGKPISDVDWGGAEKKKANAFKEFVHGVLDKADIPTHPEGPHSAEGCRIGDRLDIVLKHRDPLTNEAVSKVRGPREKEYGDKLTNFTDIAALQNAAHGYTTTSIYPRSAETVAIDNICQKLARLRKSPDHYDTLVDIIGYVLCYRDIRRTRNPEHYAKEEARFSAEKS